jgi:predicted O-methyltransferase YrrM
MPEPFTFIDDKLLRSGSLEFHCDLMVGKAPAGRIPVMKERGMVERYLDLAGRFPVRTVVELGIRAGGSTALVQELFQPDTLVAVELDGTPAPALTRYIEDQGVGDRVRPHYGVDQSDRARLRQLLDDELGDRAIDLVIDDASHLYDETRASFEVLFPRMREGGAYLIEDWNTDHLIGDAVLATLRDASAPDHDAVTAQVAARRSTPAPVATRRPLLQLAIELMLVRASWGDVVRDVEVNDSWVVVRRGAEVIDPASFRLDDLVHDHFGYLAPPTSG